MKLKKFIFFSILFILSVGVVSATDLNNTQGTDLASVDHDSLEITDNLASVNHDSLEVTDSTPYLFSSLQNDIDNAPPGSVLNLTRDYIGDSYKHINLNKDLTIDGNGHTIDCLGESHCYAFYSESGTITLKNLIIINGHADKSKGGAIYIKNATYTLENCTFKNNWAGSSGGAIYYNNENGHLTIKNCLFESNIAENDGGAIYSKQELTVYDSIFNNNLAYGDGGALYGVEDVNIYDSIFRSNSVNTKVSQAKGGAIFSEMDVYTKNSEFNENYADDYGGAIYADNVDVENCMFNENYVIANDGGAIYALNDVNALYSNFYHNKAVADGGAIYADNVNVEHCMFNENNDDVQFYSRIYDTITDTDRRGGAIFANKEVIIDNSTFLENHATTSGGAIYSESVSLRNTPSYFLNNIAYRGKGGAIYTDKFNNDVKYATFIGNSGGEATWTDKSMFNPFTSDDAGAIYINKENHLTFSQCVFIDNHGGDEGGAIYLDSSSSELSLINNIFFDNCAAYGHAVYNCGKYVTIKNNLWDDESSIFDNILVEWHGAKSYENHFDVDPLKIRLTVGSTNASVNSEIPCKISFVSALDESISPELFGIDLFRFSSSDKKDRFTNYQYGTKDINAHLSPKSISSHIISVINSYNNKNIVSGSINILDIPYSDNISQVFQNTDLYFYHFQKMVDNAPEGSTIYLNNDFIFTDMNKREGIIIDKDIVIDGQGHSFDAKSLSGIFQSKSGSITLKNIVFKNGNQQSADDGGAIRILGDAKYTIINCTFDSNHALQDGGAIYNEGKDLDIEDCTFVNNSASGANKLNDCDGGAIHSKAYLYVKNSVFKNNFADDNGGAIYATGGLQLSAIGPCYFEGNTANKGKGGAIYTNKFTSDVKYTVFINNRAGDGAIISDDGGAIYINNENWITFESCLFVNNHCTDEGGAIYLNSMSSHLTLKYNIFIGNVADDEGQSVFNCGYYDSIYNNFWGGENPSSDNDQLIEWKSTFLQKNIHHSDSDPLKMDFTLNKVDCPVNDIFNGVAHFYKSNGQLLSGELTGTNFINFTASPNIEIIHKFYNKTGADAIFAPDKSGKYTIKASLFGNSISREINVFEFEIIAPEITTFTNVPQTFKIHLEGDKSYTANQKVRVSFFKTYDLITDENGDANITFNELNLDSGSYLVEVSSCGFTVNSSVNIITTIFAEDVVQIRGDHVTFKAQFTNVEGEFLKKSTQVQFTLDGNPYYSVIEDENGTALVDFYSLTRGEHKILVTNPENGECKMYRIVILAGQ